MDFFGKQYPKYAPYNKAWKNGLFTAIVILLVFLLFQPFGFRDKETGLKLVLFPGYALIAYLHFNLNFYIIRDILKDKKTWTLGNEVVSFLTGAIVLTIVVHAFTCLVTGDMPFTFQWYFKLLYHVASLFLVIGVIEFFYYNNRSASISNQQLSSQYETVKQKLADTEMQNRDIIVISLEKEQVEINRNKIVCIQSIGNYLEFYLRDVDGAIGKITKRGRLHKAEKDLVSFPEFFKCHRAFIINLNRAVSLKGNIKNARVVFDCEIKEVPVSRAYYKSLKDRLEKIVLN